MLFISPLRLKKFSLFAPISELTIKYLLSTTTQAYLHNKNQLRHSSPIIQRALLHTFKPSCSQFQNDESKKITLTPPSPQPPPPLPITTRAATSQELQKIPRSQALQNSKEKLLLQASGPWERFAIKSKWFLIKGYRPFNIDELSAFFSWFIISHLLWIVLGTTTFFSLLFYGLNSLFAKELVGKLTGKYITWLTPGFNVKFEDAVVPEWKEGMIHFKKVVITTVDDKDSGKVKLDLKIESLKLTLSFKKWKDLKGWIQNVEITRMTGVIDKKFVKEGVPEFEIFSNEDYEVESIKIMDSKLQVLELDTKPMNISIYNCELPKVRVRWLFLDFWNVASMNGSINDSLYTIHKRQHKLAYVNDVENDFNPWKKITRFRLDQLNIEDIGLTGSQFNWLTDGKVEVTADIMQPALDGADSKVPYDSRYVVIDFKLQFSELKAIIPSELPRLSNGEPIMSYEQLKPIISYINTKRQEMDENQNGSLPPLSFRVVKRLSDLKRVSTLKESKLLDSIATEMYIDWMKHVQEFEIEQRSKKVAMWSKAVASQLLVVGLGAMA